MLHQKHRYVLIPDRTGHPVTAIGMPRLQRELARQLAALPTVAPYSALLGGVTGALDDPNVDIPLRQAIDAWIASGLIEDLDRLPITSLDISLTDRCNARCIYCPTPRRVGTDRIMPLDTIERLVRDLHAPTVTERFGKVRLIEVGGLTEPLLHPDILGALRLLQAPEVVLYTNAALLTPALSHGLLSEGLMTRLVVALGGIGAAHQASTGVPYARVETNLLAFLAARSELGATCELRLNVLPPRQYAEAVRRRLGRDPRAGSSPPAELRAGDEDGELAAVMATWQPRLAPTDSIADAIRDAGFSLRGEYEPGCEEPDNEPCPWPAYVAHAITVTAAGDWLMCCNDFHREQVLGNVPRDGLLAIATGPRLDFITALLDGQRLPARCRRARYCSFL